MSSCSLQLRRFSVCDFENSFVDRIKGSLLLCSFPKGKGGEIFSILDLCDLSVNFLFICSVAPCLNQVFRHFFSMDNLKDYGEDATASSTGLGQSLERLPSSSEGLPSSTSSQTSHGGLYNRYHAGDVGAGSRGLCPDYARLIRTSGQFSGSGGSSSSSSSGAIWGFSG